MLIAYQDGIIYICQDVLVKADMYFTVAHRLHRMWQKQYYLPEFLFTYKLRDNFISTGEHAMQKAEIIANTFATIVMVDTFEIRPTFDGMSEHKKTAISKRVEYI